MGDEKEWAFEGKRKKRQRFGMQAGVDTSLTRFGI